MNVTIGYALRAVLFFGLFVNAEGEKYTQEEGLAGSESKKGLEEAGQTK